MLRLTSCDRGYARTRYRSGRGEGPGRPGL